MTVWCGVWWREALQSSAPSTAAVATPPSSNCGSHACNALLPSPPSPLPPSPLLLPPPAPQALPLYHLSRDCSRLGPTDRLVLRQLGCGLSRGLGLPPLRCASWSPQW